MLEGVADRNAAEAMRDTLLFVDRESAIKLPEGRYFIADLIGLAVTDEEGNALGTLADVRQAGGNDVYAVEGERSFLFPAVKRAIARVDIEEGVMTLRREALAEIAVYDDDEDED
jgi:16S rRNA processing protein RimM